MANKSAIDAKRLLERCLGNTELAKQMLELFCQHAMPVVEKLKKAAAEQDWAEAKRCAHRLRGSAANLGADRLVLLAATVEDSANARMTGAVQLATTKLEEAVSMCHQDMDRLMKELS